MPFCCNCSKPQARLNKDFLCRQCHNSVGERSSYNADSFDTTNGANDGMNEYYMASCNNIGDQSNGNRLPQSNGNLRNNNSTNDTNNQNDSNNTLNEELLNKPMSEITVREIIGIINTVNQPINNKLEEICKEFDAKLSRLQTRVEFLEAENIRKNEESGTLKSIIVNMQKCLNRIDGNGRNLNIIISGLSEKDIKVENSQDQNQQLLATDENKIAWLLRFIGNEKFVNEELKNCKIERLGKERTEKKRTIKMSVPSVQVRDEILKSAKKLKTGPDDISNVYIKKDQHPVYIAENNRMRKKMFELRQKEENIDKNIKIEKGKLLVDNVVHDQNTFFH